MEGLTGWQETILVLGFGVIVGCVWNISVKADQTAQTLSEIRSLLARISERRRDSY